MNVRTYEVNPFAIDTVKIVPVNAYSSGGLSNEAKDAILDAFEHVAWIDGQGQTYIDAIHDAFYPPTPATSITLNQSALSFTTIGATQTLVATVMPSDSTDTVSWSSSDTSVATVNNGVVTTAAYGTATITATAGSVSATCSVVVAQATLTSISAVYTQSGTVYDTDSLDSLKSDLVVTATWSDSSTSTVAAADYTLSGTLTEGTSTITVTYSGKTTTFTVTVTHTAGDTTAVIETSGYVEKWSNNAIVQQAKTYGGITKKYQIPATTSLYPAGVIPFASYTIEANVGMVVAYDSNGNHVNHVSEKTGSANRWSQAAGGTYTEFSQEWIIEEYSQVTFNLDTRYLDDAYMYDKTTGLVFFAGINTPYYGMSNISEASV